VQEALSLSCPPCAPAAACSPIRCKRKGGSPVYQEKPRKCNQLLANCAIYSTAVDITATSNTLAAEAIPPTRSIWPR
jgi:hypothetical protein